MSDTRDVSRGPIRRASLTDEPPVSVAVFDGPMPDTEAILRLTIARAVKETREAIGWTQTQLAERVGVSRSLISAIEVGTGDPSMRVVGRTVDVMGIRVDIEMRAPFLADRRRQREPAHARSVVYIERRLQRLGWLNAREVEIAHGRSHGWMDLLSFEPRRRALLVTEFKTELEDVGRIERTINWYERAAWEAARRLGWRPRFVVACLLVLDTELVHRRIAENREALATGFPVRSTAFAAWLADPSHPWPMPARAVAAIDPLSRRRDWLRGLPSDGRRTPAAFTDYADLMRCLRGGRPRPRR